MKKTFLFLALILAFLEVNAQQKNVIKINTLAPFGIVYERGLTDNVSLSLQWNGFKGDINTSSAGDYTYKLNGWSLDAKYFPLTNGDKTAPEGLYFGPYLKWYPINIDGSKTETVNNIPLKGTAKLDSRIFGFGAVGGYQMISSGGFTLDVAAGGGFYSLGFDDITFQFNDGSKKTYDVPGILKYFNKTIAPRIAFSLGYAF